MLWALRKPHCATSLALYLSTTMFSIHPRMKAVTIRPGKYCTIA
jgi:hypothetical protein